MSKSKRLREGFTTGTAATAAAKAALLLLLKGESPSKVNVELPNAEHMSIEVLEYEPIDSEQAAAVVQKDAGDDPDATHKAHIRCQVRLSPSEPRGQITLKGGQGVGLITRPGLPVPVGEPAINPAPRKQISKCLAEVLLEENYPGGVQVTVECSGGEKIAQKTLNPRLGITGGISILGTRGTVKPFSLEAYKATITSGLDVARANAETTIALTTGGRSERFLKEMRPEIPWVSFIQVADFFAFSMQEAIAHGFRDIIWSCFFGKLLKMALGHAYTHAKKAAIDFDKVAGWCTACGLPDSLTDEVREANTGRHVLQIIQQSTLAPAIIEDIVRRSMQQARYFCGPEAELTYYVFDFEGNLLSTKTSRAELAGNNNQ